MKLEKKRLTQATALILALILMLTGVCTGGFSDLYSLTRSIADGTDTTKEITAFDALSGSVSTQELAVGAKENDIVFPKELKATMVERKKVAATVNETKPASVDNNAQKEGTTAPAVNPAEAAPTQAPEGAAANPADGTSEGAAANPTEAAPDGAQQNAPVQTPEGMANSTPVQAPAAATESAPAASESTTSESAPASMEGSSENTSGSSNAAENESTAPTNNDSSSESGNGLTGSVRKLTQIFALRNVQAEELTGTNAQTSDSTTSGNDTQMTENTSAASGETTTTTNAAGTENGTQTTTTGTDAQTTTGTPAETVGGATDAAAVSTPETSVPTSEATTETTNNIVAAPQTPAAQPAASTVTVSESDKDKFETTTTQTITLSDISWRIDAGASSGSAFSSEKAGATFVYVPMISGDYTVSADLPRITVKIVDELRPEVELTQIVDGIKITLRAEKGVFPAGVTMSARRVTDYEEDNVENAVEEVRKEEKNVVDSYTFDIKVLDKNGNEIQPDTSKGKVSVSFTMEEVTNDNLEADVYHIKGKELSMSAEELNEKTTNGDTVEAKTDGFSYYTVEFTYNDLQYVLPGGSVVPLSQILTTVGLTGTVSDARGSNPELFTVGKVAVQADGTPARDALGNPIADENGAWYVVSKAAFSTDEWMKVTIAGVEYEIKVTDTVDLAIDSVTELRDMGSDKNYHLTANITLDNQGPWVIGAGENLRLDLKGFSICAPRNSFDSVINVQNGGTLTLTDTVLPSTPYKFRPDNWEVWKKDDSGSESVSAGIIYGAGNGIVVNAGGTLNMNGGAIVGNFKPGCRGGGIRNRGTITLDNVKICGNRAGYYGGGIYNENGTITINGGEIYKNISETYAGGIANSSGTVTLNSGVRITDNHGEVYGGGISNHSSGTVNLNNVTISGNISDRDGGGIWNEGTVTSSNTSDVRIENNKARKGGGILNSNAMTLVNATITSNTANAQGGGIFDESRGQVSFDRCSITGNNGVQNVGGIYKTSYGAVTVMDTTITNNTTTNGSEGGFYIEETSTSNVSFEGKVVINRNTCKNSEFSNLCINRDGAVKISNPLTTGTHIGVTHRNGTGTITTGFATHSQGVAAFAYFTADDDVIFAIDENREGEAILDLTADVTNPQPNPIIDGQTLGECALVGGLVKKDDVEIPGTFAWLDPSIIPQLEDSGRTEYYIVFTASDRALSFTIPTLVTVLEKIDPVVYITGWKVGAPANEPSVTGNPGIGTVTYSYKVKGAGDDTYTTTVPTNAGEYTIKADIAQTADYASGSATADFVIYEDTVETKTEAKGGAPNITVEGLSDVLTDADKSAAGTTNVYEISLSSEKKTESTAEGVSQIKALLDSTQQLETLLDLTLYKTTTTLASDSTKTITKTENIGGTNTKVLGLAIPYQTSGKTLMLLRFHGGSAAKLAPLGAKPAGGYTDGTYFIDTANNVIYVYASGYSTYAIAVDTAGGGSGGGGSWDGPGGSSGGSSGSSSSNSSNNSNNNAQSAAAQAQAQAAAAQAAAAQAAAAQAAAAQAAAAQAAAAQAAAAQAAAVQPAAENTKVQNTKAGSAKKSNGTAGASADAGSLEETATEDITDYQPTTDTDKTTMTAKVSTDEPKQTTSNTEATPKKNKGLGILLLILLLVVAGGVILVATSTVGKRKNQ